MEMEWDAEYSEQVVYVALDCMDAALEERGLRAEDVDESDRSYGQVMEEVAYEVYQYETEGEAMGIWETERGYESGLVVARERLDDLVLLD